jgi:hypothetical protein
MPLNKARFSDSHHGKEETGNHRRSGSRAVFPLENVLEALLLPWVKSYISVGRKTSLTVEKGFNPSGL